MRRPAWVLSHAASSAWWRDRSRCSTHGSEAFALRSACWSTRSDIVGHLGIAPAMRPCSASTRSRRFSPGTDAAGVAVAAAKRSAAATTPSPGTTTLLRHSMRRPATSSTAVPPEASRRPVPRVSGSHRHRVPRHLDVHLIIGQLRDAQTAAIRACRQAAAVCRPFQPMRLVAEPRGTVVRRATMKRSAAVPSAACRSSRPPFRTSSMRTAPIRNPSSGPRVPTAILASIARFAQRTVEAHPLRSRTTVTGH